MALQIPLSRGLFALVDDEDHARIAAHTWYARPGGGPHHPNHYAVRKGTKDEPGTIYMHRAVMGARKGEALDHRDRDGLNNTKSNLRFATGSQNCSNVVRASQSGFRGVYRCLRSGGWYAQIQVERQARHLGRFEDKAAAARAYDRAAIRAFGEFATLNFPDEHLVERAA